MRVINLRR